jgi:hypothetical protein
LKQGAELPLPSFSRRSATADLELFMRSPFTAIAGTPCAKDAGGFAVSCLLYGIRTAAPGY